MRTFALVGEFLVECYASAVPPEGVRRSAARAHAAAEELAHEGTPIRYVRAIFVPADETCFFLYEADSADVVREAVRRAGLSYERVSESLTTKEDEFP